MKYETDFRYLIQKKNAGNIMEQATARAGPRPGRL